MYTSWKAMRHALHYVPTCDHAMQKDSYVCWQDEQSATIQSSATCLTFVLLLNILEWLKQMQFLNIALGSEKLISFTIFRYCID